MQFPFDQSLLMPSKLDATVKQSGDIYSTILNMLAMPEMMKTQRATAQETLKQKQLENQYYPVNELMAASRVQNAADATANSKSRFGAAYLFSKQFASLPPQEKKQYFADHPGSYEMLMAAQGNQAMKDVVTKADNSSGSSSSSSSLYGKQIHDMLVANGALPAPDEDEDNSDQSTAISSPTPTSSAPVQQTNMAAPAVAMPPPPTNQQAQISPQQAQLLKQMGFGQPGGPKVPLQAAQPMPQSIPPQMANPALMPPQSAPQAPVQAPPPAIPVPPPAAPPMQTAPNAPYSGNTDFTPTNAQVESAGNSAKIDSNRALNSATLNNRIDQGEAISHLFEQPAILKSLATLTKYSGVEGKAKLAWARAAHPKEWLEYQNASDQLGTIISGSLKGIENIPTSNEGMRAGKDYINKAALLATGKGDPAAVANYLVKGIDLVMSEQNALLETGQKAFPNQIPQHKKIRNMLDDIADGKNPNEVLTLNKSPKTGQVSMGVESAGGNRSLSSQQPESKSDANGRMMVRLPGKPWKYQDEL